MHACTQAHMIHIKQTQTDRQTDRQTDTHTHTHTHTHTCTLVRHYICLSMKSRNSGFSSPKNRPEFEFAFREFLCQCLILHGQNTHRQINTCIKILVLLISHTAHRRNISATLAYTHALKQTPFRLNCNTLIRTRVSRYIISTWKSVSKQINQLVGKT